jgi:hypothetical protein
MEGKEKKEVIQLGVEFLRSRSIDSVIRSHGKLLTRAEVTKQWNEANKKK